METETGNLSYMTGHIFSRQTDRLLGKSAVCVTNKPYDPYKILQIRSKIMLEKLGYLSSSCNPQFLCRTFILLKIRKPSKLVQRWRLVLGRYPVRISD
jgi:hypothetical protein